MRRTANDGRILIDLIDGLRGQGAVGVPEKEKRI